MPNTIILGLFSSWKIEKSKTKYFITQDKIKEKDFYLLPNQMNPITVNTAITYRKIYRKTDFTHFISLIPDNFPYTVVLYCGIDGYYDVNKKIIYLGVNPNKTEAGFHNTLMHECCHLDYDKHLKQLPHWFRENVVDIITEKKYGLMREDDMDPLASFYDEIDPNRPVTIFKTAQKYGLLTQESEKEPNVFPCIS